MLCPRTYTIIHDIHGLIKTHQHALYVFYPNVRKIRVLIKKRSFSGFVSFFIEGGVGEKREGFSIIVDYLVCVLSIIA